MEESMVSVHKLKETRYLMIDSQLTDCLTLWSRVHLDKLTVPLLTEKFSTFYETQMFTIFAVVWHMSLS
jgi:hypothetical protein